MNVFRLICTALNKLYIIAVLRYQSTNAKILFRVLLRWHTGRMHCITAASHWITGVLSDMEAALAKCFINEKRLTEILLKVQQSIRINNS